MSVIEERAVFLCQNTMCTLGSRKQEGRFAGGMTPEGRALLTGEPVESFEEGVHFGEGVCPNCGVLGLSTADEDGNIQVHKVVEKVGDPHQDLHDEINTRVLDKKDPLTAVDSQEILKSAVEARLHAETEAKAFEEVSDAE